MENEWKRTKNRNLSKRRGGGGGGENLAFTWRRMEKSEFLISMVEFSPLHQCYWQIYGNASREMFRRPRLFLSKSPPPPWRFGPIPGHGVPLRGFAFTFIGHTKFGRTPLDEWSARRRDLCLTILKSNKRQISMFPTGFDTKVPLSKWSQTARPLGLALSKLRLANNRFIRSHMEPWTSPMS
jgi:hypothetical protein